MEYLNKIQLRGIVGSVRTTEIGKQTFIHLSVATNQVYRKDGEAVIETTWHTVVSISTAMVYVPKKGNCVEVEGRLRHQRYTGANGDERFFTEVVAKKVKILPDDRLNCEMVSGD